MKTIETLTVKYGGTPYYSVVVPVSRRWALPIVWETLLRSEVPADCELLLFVDDRLLNESIAKYLCDGNGRAVCERFESVRIVFSNRLPYHDQAEVEKRRARIATVWQELSFYIRGTIVLGFEDDTQFPPDAFTKLRFMLHVTPKLRFASAVECGRWGMEYVGAWRVSDTEIRSLPFAEDGIFDVQGAGLYCFAGYAEDFKRHDWLRPTEPLGCDVALVQTAIQKGCAAAVDFGIRCIHHQQEGRPILVTDKAVTVGWEKVGGEWELRL